MSALRRQADDSRGRFSTYLPRFDRPHGAGRSDHDSRDGASASDGCDGPGERIVGALPSVGCHVSVGHPLVHAMQSDVSTAGADQDRGRTVEELERELAEARRREAATSRESCGHQQLADRCAAGVRSDRARSAVELVRRGIQRASIGSTASCSIIVAQHNYTADAVEEARALYPARLGRALGPSRAILERGRRPRT